MSCFPNKGRPAQAGWPPRLLTEREAADYLRLPRASMRRLLEGRLILDGRVRWDRRALDTWLDRESGIATFNVANDDRDEAESALNDWLAHKKHAPRRP